MRRPGRAPGRFVSSQTIKANRGSGSSVAATPITRFDRKDVMERDLERYRAEARERLLRNGFDIPDFLMPKAPEASDPDDEDDPDRAKRARLNEHVLPGPKPEMFDPNRPDRSDRLPGTAKRHSSHQARPMSGFFAMLRGIDPGKASKNPTPSPNASYRRVDQAEQENHNAYQEYLDSLHGGHALMDTLRDDDGDDDISGRVDELKSARRGKGRIDLPDNTSNWVGRNGRAVRSNMNSRAAESQPVRRGQSSPISWNRVFARLLAYMVAAVAIGYILVLTVGEFTTILR
ncbi:hypothetical protein LPB41_12610 [Thalassospira sp. MA62]|nr:hypothetical protein [Thalassospira sp. MA62]